MSCNSERFASGKRNFFLLLLIAAAVFSSACISTKESIKVPVVLEVSDADKAALIKEINRFAEVKAVNAKMDVKFEDNSFADSGLIERYKAADGRVIVQSPANIFLKIQIPVVGTDIVQMTSDGDKFRVAVICCVSDEYKKFVYGTNEGDYAVLERKAKQVMSGNNEKKAISVFSSLRPQHFTDALLMRPVKENGDLIYTQSEIYQDEQEPTKEKSRVSRVIRGYYLLDELTKNGDGSDYKIARRFWFDRTVNGVRLARQQIFDDRGVLITDVTYGADGKFTENENITMPVVVTVTRPQERYSVKLTYQNPKAVTIGNSYEQKVFQLENTWNLPEVDLDKRKQQPDMTATPK